MSKKKENFRDKLSDWIWPRRTGPRESQPKGECAPDGSEEILIKVEEYARAFATREEEREKTTDRKLFSLFSISSVASSVIIAGLIGAATVTLPETTSGLKYLVTPAIVLIGYIALQLLIAVGNTVQGLSARGYLSANADSVLPNEEDDKGKYMARQHDENHQTEQLGHQPESKPHERRAPSTYQHISGRVSTVICSPCLSCLPSPPVRGY